MKSYIHTINPLIANTIGESGSILLNQLEYWLSKCGKDIEGFTGKWIYNSHKQWSEQFSYWSISKLRRTIKLLEDLGLIKSIKANAKKWDQTKYYSINYSSYNRLLRDNNYSASSYHYLDTHKSVATKLSKLKSLSGIKTNNSQDTIFSKKNSMQQNYQRNRKVKILDQSNTKNNLDKSPQPAEICICSKRANQCVQNEQLLYYTKNNNTKNISYTKKETFKKTHNEIDTLEKRKETINKMVESWNKIFEFSKNPIKAYVQLKNAGSLLQVLKIYFNDDIKLWKEYALKVNSSKFLMGEKETKNNFKANFIWLIKPDTIEKIMNDEYGIGDRVIDVDNSSKNIEIKKQEIIENVEKQQMKFIKKIINNKQEETNFDNYIRSLQYDSNKDEYKMAPLIRQITALNLLKINESKVLRKNLYENYIMKKYMKMSKIQARKKLHLWLDDLTKNAKDEYSVMKKLNQKGKYIRELIIPYGDVIPNIHMLINVNEKN